MCKNLIYWMCFGLVLSVSAGMTNAAIIAYWPFDEGSGDVAEDVVGGFDAQLTNVDWLAGQFEGSAIKCDRSGDRISVGTGPTPTTKDLSFAFWMVDTHDSFATIMNKYVTDSVAGYGILLRPESEDSPLRLRIGGWQAYGGWGAECRVPKGAYKDGEWVHVICTYDSASDTASIYINGELPANGEFNPKGGSVRPIAGPAGYCQGVNDPAQPLYIVGPPGEAFGGIVDEVAIWDHALTADEVLKVYTLGPLMLDPRAARKPFPEDEATDVPRDVVLSWTAGESATGHSVYLGESFADVDGATGGITQAATTYPPAQRLDFDTTYYWRVDEVGATTFKGTVWSFTTEPVAYAVPAGSITVSASSADTDQGPENTINGSGLADDLHSDELTAMWTTALGATGPAWIQYEFDRVLKLHEMWVWNHNGLLEPAIGFGCKDVTIEYSVDGTNFATLGTTHEFARAPGVAGNAVDTTVNLGGAAAKYVKLTVNSNWGGILAQYGLSEVRFFYIPVLAREPNPASGAEDVSVTATLGWRAGREAAKHNVSLSTDEQAVIDGTAPVETVTEASYGASLDMGSTYYWRVDEVNDAESPTVWQGEIWNFSTPEYLIVDDFESYNDIGAGEEGSNLVYETWVDGYANPSVNGSTMGYTVPFEPTMETSIVIDGGQSAPFFYDNTTASYSEVTANTSDLAIGRDWTKGGAKTLVLWVRISLSSASAEKLYVKINGTKVLYDGDKSVPGWKQWNIDLASLGVNLSNVTTLAIGVDGGGSGVIYVDHIALYRIAPPVIQPGPDPSLVGHWKLDETSGLTAVDSSGYNNHGTLTGMTGTEWTAGIRDGALGFDGNGIVDCGNDPSLRLTGEVTVSAWVKMEPANEGVYMGIGGKLVSGPYNGYALVRHSSNLFRLWMGNDGGDLSNVSSDVAYTDTDWHHVVGVIANNTGSLYVDGIKQAGEAAVGLVDTGDYAFIGKQYSNGSDRYWVGTVDDFRIYQRALSAQEILGL